MKANNTNTARKFRPVPPPTTSVPPKQRSPLAGFIVCALSGSFVGFAFGLSLGFLFGIGNAFQ